MQPIRILNSQVKKIKASGRRLQIFNLSDPIVIRRPGRSDKHALGNMPKVGIMVNPLDVKQNKPRLLGVNAMNYLQIRGFL